MGGGEKEEREKWTERGKGKSEREVGESGKGKEEKERATYLVRMFL